MDALPAVRLGMDHGRTERTAQGYRRFRCSVCGRQFSERSGGLLNRAQHPSDVIALVVLRRLRYQLDPRDLAEMFPARCWSSADRTRPPLTEEQMDAARGGFPPA